MRAAVAVPRIVAGLFALFYLLSLAHYAWQVSGTSLQDPDTCWILSLGKRICEDRAIPSQDPFSFTIPLVLKASDVATDSKPPAQFVPYQWLSEVTLYSIYSTTASDTYNRMTVREKVAAIYGDAKKTVPNVGFPDPALMGLATTAALIVLAAFIVVPLLYGRAAGSSMLASSLICLLGLQAGSFHFFLRPEIFSYLFLAILLASLALARRQQDKSLKKLWWLPVTATLLQIAWANFHSGFVCSVLLLTVVALWSTINKLTGIQEETGFLKAVWLSLAGVIMASFMTPFGSDLWSYLPHLFFAPFNRLNEELQPIGMQLFSKSFQPFTWLCLLGIGFMTAGCVLLRKRSATVKSELTFSIVIVALSLFVGFACRRLVPFSAILIVSELLSVLYLLGDRDNQPAQEVDNVLVRADRILTDIATKRRLLSAICILAVAGIASHYQCQLFPPRIPQFSYYFPAPFDAMQFVESNNQSGNLLNDPQFGDMLVWHLKEPPKLFIDTRFDAYGVKIITDFATIANCGEGWSALLDKYEIGWVFMPANTLIAQELLKSEDWTTAFKDSAAIICIRKVDSKTGDLDAD